MFIFVLTGIFIKDNDFTSPAEVVDMNSVDAVVLDLSDEIDGIVVTGVDVFIIVLVRTVAIAKLVLDEEDENHSELNGVVF